MDIPENSGVIRVIDGKKVAVYNDRGTLISLSPTCPHLGCDVEWNAQESTWDCPCHGSRFEKDGTLKKGPAKRGLDPIVL